jgi:hypothetical protein
VHRRRPAGDDREVVGIGEARHDAVGKQVGACRLDAAQGRRPAGPDRRLDVARFRAVDAVKGARRKSDIVSSRPVQPRLAHSNRSLLRIRTLRIS